MSNLPDVQNRPDERGLAIDRVGVNKFFLPIVFEEQERIAGVSAYVSLPHTTRGANFSRFVITATKHFSNKKINSQVITEMLRELKKVMKSEDAYVDLEFDYLIEKESPVTKIKGGYQSYKLGFIGLLKEDKVTIIRRFEIVAASLCPCSREMSLLENLEYDNIKWNLPERENDVESGYEKLTKEIFQGVSHVELSQQVGKGAHNQRVTIRVDVEFNNGFDLNTKEIIKGIEDCASAGVYPILKRPDEKWVTERAYERPRFVEDIVREAAGYLNNSHKDILNGYSIRCIADESIHQHNAIAYLSNNWKLH